MLDFPFPFLYNGEKQKGPDIDMALKNGDLVLFLGDSITDCERSRENTDDLGKGYPRLAQSALSVLRADLSLRFLNRGISGDRTIDVLNRLEKDCLSLKPALLSILLGINDIWHRQENHGCTDEELEENYTKILTRVRETLGDIPIIMLEPYLTPDHTTNMAREEVDRILPIIRRLAEKFDAVLIPLDSLLAKAADAFPPLTLTEEGVHPKPEGHGIIAKHWLDAALPLL